MATASTYKLKKNETLAQVAKSHGLQVTEIWKFSANKALVKKRGTPEKCEAGDAVELPPGKADRQAAIAKLEAFMAGLQQRSIEVWT